MTSRLSLKAKLIGAILATTLVALVIALLSMIGYDLSIYRETWFSGLERQAELLGQMTAPALEFEDVGLARANLGLYRFTPTMRAAAIYNARGQLFATYAVSAGENVFPRAPETDGIRQENEDLVAVKHIVNHGEPLGTIYLRARYQLHERIWNYVGIAALVTLLAMLIALTISTWLQKRLMGPLLAIGRTAREVTRDRDYSRRAEILSRDEVGALAESFNDMLAEIEKRAREREASRDELAAEVHERRLAEQEVLRLNAGLELRVQERTAQLEDSNRELATATAAAEDANRAKSEFLSSMSHELRTPLNAIIGFGQLLASENIPSTPEQKKRFIEHVLKASNHLLTLINEVLDLARIESGHLTLSLEPVGMAEVMAECQIMLVPVAGQRDIHLVFPADSGLRVVADRTRLKQIVLNLLSNAIKYNRDSGSVIVDCRQTESRRVSVSVQDTGIGLNAAQLAALFQPFNRLGQESGAVEGTGIGLVVTKRLVEMMGGEIAVTSQPGSGSLFRIELPLADSPAPTAAAPAHTTVPAAASAMAEPAASASATLLYVEDNPANLKLVQELIALRPELRLLTAPDGHLGIELARAHLPRLILMDLNLPGVNGTDAMLILRSDPATAHIPIIALTANAMPRDIAKGLAAGFYRYITKPIDIEAFNATVTEALQYAESRLPGKA